MDLSRRNGRHVADSAVYVKWMLYFVFRDRFCYGESFRLYCPRYPPNIMLL